MLKCGTDGVTGIFVNHYHEFTNATRNTPTLKPPLPIYYSNTHEEDLYTDIISNEVQQTNYSLENVSSAPDLKQTSRLNISVINIFDALHNFQQVLTIIKNAIKNSVYTDDLAVFINRKNYSYIQLQS